MIQHDILIKHNIKFNLKFIKTDSRNGTATATIPAIHSLLTHTDREPSNTGPLNP
jgi:DNA polymerase III alpha subunit (gram-positive type)